MFDRKAAFLCSLLIFLLAWAVAPCMAANQAGEAAPPARVAVLPFTMNTPANLNYLQSGVRDMLSSRLSWQGKVHVVDKAETDKVGRAVKEMNQGEAVRIGTALKADYILYGSITSTGQAVSIDAKMVPVSGKTDPVSFYAQTKSLDDVMPQVNLFAQQINQKIFGKPEEKPQGASAEAEALATRNPELLLPGAAATGDKISYVNPNFVEVTPEGSLRQPGFWRSQDFQGGMLGMDLGDIDGDGRDEIVTVQMRKLMVFRKENQGLKVLDSFEGTPVDRFLWVCVANVPGEKQSYIYLTNLRTRNSTKPQFDTAQDNPSQGNDLYSYVMSFSGGKLHIVAEGVPYYLSTTQLGRRGKVLIGQKQGDKYQNAFAGPIYEMQLRGASLTPGPEVDVPKGATVFNFVKAEITSDRVEKVILIDDHFKLRILSTSGDQIWKDTGLWGATTNAIESRVEDRRWGMVDYYAIPSPIIVTDLRKNGIPEIVMNRNTTNFDKWLPNSMKYYDQGEIVSMSWDNMGMTENWQTKGLNGQITALRIGDLEGNGKKQLVVDMVFAKDPLKLYESRSVIFTYDLNVKEGSAGKSAAAPADERENVPIQSDKTPDTPKNESLPKHRGDI